MNDASTSKARSKKYHKRSPIACDECKLRKKKCDGGNPCGSCTLYQKECTYESKTRPSQRPTVRIRNLEDNLRSVRTLLTQLKPELSGTSLGDVERMLNLLKPAAEESVASEQSDEPLRSMLTGRGLLLRSAGRTFFHGPYSGPAMICSILAFFDGADTDAIHPYVVQLFDAEDSQVQAASAQFSYGPQLPERSEAASLFSVVIAQSHPFLQFLDPGLGMGLSDVLEFSYGNTNLPEITDGQGATALCHIILALGYLVDPTRHQDYGCVLTKLHANRHFVVSRQVLDLTEVNTLVRLQTVLCTIVYLISTSRISAAYPYISVASTSAIKQGLHIQTDASASNGDVSFKSTRKLILTTLVNLDLYVSTILGLPPLINIDTAGTTLEATRNSANQARSQGFFGDQHLRHNFQTISGDVAFKYCQLVSLTASVMWEFSASSTDRYPTSNPTPRKLSEVDAVALSNAEDSLRKWTKGIGIAISPAASSTPRNTSEELPNRVLAAKYELELSFYWAQLLLYLPFLHYLQPLKEGQNLPELLSRPALTCLKVAANTIVRCDSIMQSLSASPACNSIMHPSNWTCIYTVFLAVVALVFLISIHEGTSKPGEAWRHAERGIRLLASLQCNHPGPANRCMDVIKEIVRQLNYTVDFDLAEIERTTVRICDMQRQRMTSASVSAVGTPTTPGFTYGSTQLPGGTPQIAQMQEHPVIIDPAAMSTADSMLASAQEMILTNESPPKQRMVSS